MSKVTVTELNTSIAQAIVNGIKKTVTVVGEVSNPKVKGNHTYMTLKDACSSIDVKFWGIQIKDSDAKHGDNVEITGKVDYYVPYGSMGFIGRKIERIGVGSIHAQYEKTRKEYEKKGYFNNKKPIPTSIKNIGVVTAESGAALQDFIRVLKNNKFSGRVFVYDAWVQGPRCPDSVATGIRFFDSPFYVNVDNRMSNIITPRISDGPSEGCGRVADKIPCNGAFPLDGNLTESSDDSIDPFNQKVKPGECIGVGKHINDNGHDSDDDDHNDGSGCISNTGRDKSSHGLHGLHGRDTDVMGTQDDHEHVVVDVVVVMRGGGSFEDMMGFSHPTVLEAIYMSKHYTISSVGHEIDDMLSDFVANCAVGTPSMAGDIISKTCSNGYEKLHEIEKTIMRYRQDIVRQLYSIRRAMDKIDNQIEDPIEGVIRTIQDIQDRCRDMGWKSVNRYSKKIQSIRERISHHDCAGLLGNGFSILVSSDGKIIKDESRLFDQNIKLIHVTGNYEIQIRRI